MNLVEVDRKWVLPVSLVGAAITLSLDYVTGPFIHFPILFVGPILFAAWHTGPAYSLLLAWVMPLIRVTFEVFWEKPWGAWEMMVNFAVQAIVFSLVALLTSRVAAQHRELSREVKALEGLLPICSFCKKIRNEEEKWEPIELYIKSRSDAEFSHGLCPECAQKHYGEFLKS